MADYEIFAPDAAAMSVFATSIRSISVEHELIVYGTKYLPTGMTVPALGLSVPEKAAQPGIYGILRWLGDTTLIPVLTGGVTVTTPIPANSQHFAP
jgi:hypothetical protein